MGKELDRAPEAFLRAFGITIEVGILAIVTAARVVLHSLDLAVCLCLDVLVEDVVVGKLPQNALLPLVCQKSAFCRPLARVAFSYPHTACRQSRARAYRPASYANPGVWDHPSRSAGKNHADPGRWATC